jgi:hypothetical protein
VTSPVRTNRVVSNKVFQNSSVPRLSKVFSGTRLAEAPGKGKDFVARTGFDNESARAVPTC